MTTENTKLAVHTIVDQNDEDAVLEMIGEQMHEYIDEDEIEEYGSLYDAYSELGHWEAESDIIDQIIRGCGVELTTDEYIEVTQTLCEVWGISIN